MFNPNQKCVVIQNAGNDVYGMPQLGARSTEGFAIIHLNVTSAKSAIRADTSATRGNADELEVDAKFLLTAKTKASIDDLIEYGGIRFRILSKFPRHSLRGVLDHHEVTCTYWSRA